MQMTATNSTIPFDIDVRKEKLLSKSIESVKCEIKLVAKPTGRGSSIWMYNKYVRMMWQSRKKISKRRWPEEKSRRWQWTQTHKQCLWDWSCDNGTANSLFSVCIISVFVSIFDVKLSDQSRHVHKPSVNTHSRCTVCGAAAGCWRQPTKHIDAKRVNFNDFMHILSHNSRALHCEHTHRYDWAVASELIMITVRFGRCAHHMPLNLKYRQRFHDWCCHFSIVARFNTHSLDAQFCVLCAIVVDLMI